MTAAALAIVERAHRGAVEGQFADVLYLARELHRQMGLDLALRGEAVTYAAAGALAGTVTVGSRTVSRLPHGPTALRALLDEGAQVSADAADVAAHGLDPTDLVDGVRCVDAATLTARWPDYAHVWFL